MQASAAEPMSSLLETSTENLNNGCWIEHGKRCRKQSVTKHDPVTSASSFLRLRRSGGNPPVLRRDHRTTAAGDVGGAGRAGRIFRQVRDFLSHVLRTRGR